ncbi:MAG: hypothetical protein JRN26_02380 [Nitrososphaerota archaeon]|nr:hypothetical protein [Nitrososphaerota archaeon]
MTRSMGGTRKRTRERIKKMAEEALRESNMDRIFNAAGASEIDETAGMALKSLLAAKTADYTMLAVKEAKKRGMRLGAAALVIATESRLG